MQFVLGMRALEQLAEPGTLRLCIAGKVEYDEMPFDKSAQTCGPSAFFNGEEYLTNRGTSVMSPGNRQSRNSS